jgi:hypothetical protein
MTLRVGVIVATAALGVLATPSAAVADAGCRPGGPPPGAVTTNASAVYGQPATLWIANDVTVGITTADGTGTASIHTASPIPTQALLIDAQQDGTHQIIADTGREADLYTVSGCNITTVVDQQGKPFQFDIGHRRGTGDGYGCADLGHGPHLIGYLNLPDQPGMMRRTEIDLNGATASIGGSDTVPTNSDLSCGGVTVAFGRSATG